MKQTSEEQPSQQQQKQFWLLPRQLGLAQSQFFAKTACYFSQMTSDRDRDNANKKKKILKILHRPFPPSHEIIIITGNDKNKFKFLLLTLWSFSIYGLWFKFSSSYFIRNYEGVFFLLRKAESLSQSHDSSDTSGKKPTISLPVVFYISKTIYTAMIFWDINSGLDSGIQLWTSKLHYLRWRHDHFFQFGTERHFSSVIMVTRTSSTALLLPHFKALHSGQGAAAAHPYISLLHCLYIQPDGLHIQLPLIRHKLGFRRKTSIRSSMEISFWKVS